MGSIFGALIAPELVPNLPQLPDGWASLIGALLGASITSASALLVVQHQHRLTQKARKDEIYADIVCALCLVEEAVEFYEHTQTTNYYQDIVETDGVVIETSQALEIAARKCFRQIDLFNNILEETIHEISTVDLSAGVPLTIRRKYKSLIDEITGLREWINSFDTMSLRDEPPHKMIEL